MDDPATPRTQVEVAIAIVFDSIHQQILICKRKADTVLAGYWEFPGGKCEPGEPPATCVLREMLEETALRIRILASLPIIEHDYSHAHVRLHPFVCELLSPKEELQLLQVAEARWIAPADLADYQFPEANAPLLTAIAAGLPNLDSPPPSH